MFFSLSTGTLCVSCQIVKKNNRMAVSGLDEMLKRQEDLHIIVCVCVAAKSPPEQ